MIDARTTAKAVPRTDQLRQLTRINHAFSYTTSLDEVTRLTVEEGAALVDATAAVLMLQDADEMLHVRAAHGIADERVERFSAPRADEVIARLEGLLGVSHDRLLAVPLVARGEVIGLLALSLAAPAAEMDEWLLSALADQAASALENARLFGEVRIDLADQLRLSKGATDAKDRALSTLAHDIRSPLGAIEGYCTIMEDGLYGPISDKQREGLGRIRMAGRHLLSLLDNVMDMARLSAGAVQVRAEPVHLLEVAREAVDLLMPASYAKRHRLRLAPGPDLVVTADGARLRQVLVNLIGNAVKFTPVDGEITVETHVDPDRKDSFGQVRVCDTGPGISATDQASIFEPYYRAESTAVAPGVGLGLAISHSLVEQMGGRLEVESTLGAGSRFTIHLPLAGPQ